MVNKKLLPKYDLINSITTLQDSLRVPKYDLINSITTLQDSLRVPKYDLINSITALQDSLRVPKYDLINSVTALQDSLRVPKYDLINSVTALQDSLRVPKYDLINSITALQESFNTGALKNVRQFMSSINFEELSEVINGFDEIIETTSSESNDLLSKVQVTYNTDELLELIDSRIAEQQAKSSTEKFTLKRFLYDLALNVSTEVAKIFINIVLSTMLVVYGYSAIENHFSLINQLQINIYETEVNDYREIKRIIKADNTLVNYEYINEIGIIRKDTFIRNNNNRKSRLAYPNLIPQNTVVSIVGNRNSWILVQLIIEDEIVEGWIEKSKVIKFKKNNETKATRYIY